MERSLSAIIRRAGPKTHTLYFMSWFASRYLVTSEGRVFNQKTGKQLKHSIDRLGYHRVHLQIDGRRISTGVHRLVALHYLSRPSEGDILGWEVNHIDCNKSNNSHSNLEWVTHSQNMDHARVQKRMTKHSRKKGLRNEALVDLYSLGWTPNRLAKLFEISATRVNKIIEDNND